MSWWLYVIIILIALKIYHVWTCGICKSAEKLTGKLVIITGANTGIGYETAKDIARRGAKVILACRDDKRGTDAKNKIIAETGNPDVYYKKLDLSSFESVRLFAMDIMNNETHLDILINNAGAAGHDQKRSVDGLIMEYQINYFGHFLLTNLLLPLLKKSAPSRIINVTSVLHWFGTTNFSVLDRKIWSALRVYSNSKLFNVYFTKELSKRLEDTGVTVNCLHPGSCKSEIYRNGNFAYRYGSWIFNNLFFKNEREGAQTTIYLAVSSEVKNITGKYFADCKPSWVAPKANDAAKSKELWDLTEKMINMDKYISAK